MRNFIKLLVIIAVAFLIHGLVFFLFDHPAMVVSGGLITLFLVLILRKRLRTSR